MEHKEATEGQTVSLAFGEHAQSAQCPGRMGTRAGTGISSRGWLRLESGPVLQTP